MPTDKEPDVFGPMVKALAGYKAPLQPAAPKPKSYRTANAERRATVGAFIEDRSRVVIEKDSGHFYAEGRRYSGPTDDR